MTNAMLLTREGPIGRITLNRPDDGNGINNDMMRDMRAVGAELAEDRDIRAIIFDAKGKNFCVGGDIRVFTGLASEGPSGLRDFIESFHFFIRKVRAHPAPVISVVQGAAAGAGLSLALLGDLAIAGASSKYAVAYRKLGTSPDGGSTFFLPRAIGRRKAAELMILRDVIDAQEALALGIVNRVVPDAELAGEAQKMDEAIAANAQMAMANMKMLLNAPILAELDAQLDLERDAFAACSQTADFAEGVKAFLEKRPAQFN